MEKLDHEGFYIPNEAAFSFFMSVYRHACQVCVDASSYFSSFMLTCK